MARWLIACERSGVIRRAMRKLGYDAWSCDIEPSDDNSCYHIQDDAIKVAYAGALVKVPRFGEPVIDVREPWDGMIAHPECTYLANSGAKNLYLGEGNHRRKENGPDPDRWAKMGYAASFYMTLRNAPIKKKIIENPVMLGHARRLFDIPKPTQIVQPWMFGDYETKGTGLDIIGLPPLVPKYKTWEECRDAIGLDMTAKPFQRVFHMTPSADRKKERSRTYDGIANAIAEQWGHLA